MTRKNNALTALAVVTLILTASVAGPVALTASAQSDDESGVVDTLFGSDEDEDTDTITVVTAFVGGVADRLNPLAERPEKANADEYGSNVQSTFNSNSDALMDWTNTRASGTEDEDVVRLKFTDESGNTDYRFIVTDVNATTGNYTSVRMMNASEFQNTDRDHDLTFRMTPYASRNADEELNTFIDEYAEPGEDVDRSYLARIGGEYRDEISGDDLPGADN